MADLITALVIGGAGFIGRATCRALAERGLRVVAGDVTGAAMDFPFQRTDVTQLDSVCQSFREVNPHVVVNLAYLLADETESDPSRAFHVNVAGMQHVFEACSFFDVERCVYASSLAVYGDQSMWGAREASEDDFGRPVRLYGWHKVLNEVTAQRYDRTCVTRFIGLRISSVYGAGREIGLSAPINALLASARSGSTAQSPWSGDTEFNVIHVDDVAEAFAALATAPNLEHSVYNSGGETVSIGDLERIVRAVNPLAEITYAEPPVPPFAHSSRIDWSRLRTELGLRRSSVEERLTVEVANARKVAPS